MKKENYTVYTYYSRKHGKFGYVKAHSVEEAIELARKDGDNVKPTDLQVGL